MLTPRTRIIPDNLIVTHLVNAVVFLYGTQNVINLVSRTRHCIEPYFLKIHLNVSLVSTPTSSIFFSIFVFLAKIPLHSHLNDILQSFSLLLCQGRWRGGRFMQRISRNFNMLHAVLRQFQTTKDEIDKQFEL
jgi:hypothetical protein